MITIHATRVRAGRPGREANYVVTCLCGWRANCATLRPAFADGVAEDHMRDALDELVVP